jgi:hypothetical protein
MVARRTSAVAEPCLRLGRLHLLVALLAVPNCATAASSELARLFQEDQADRAGGFAQVQWPVMSKRDAQRRRRVREILDDGGARSSDDFFHAAMIFQHGETAADYQLARSLAMEAIQLDPKNQEARWLAAAARDRELMNLGKPQLYGTQFRREGARWVLYRVDPTMTDEERARWNVPPLESARQRAEQMSAPK